MKRIETLGKNGRMSSRELSCLISDAVAQGEHDFRIAASGQHNIGAALWSRDPQPIHLEVSNPGQRVGGMCLAGTKVVVEGPVPADAGWLNSGGEIVIKGDAGDTAGHCAAAGKIYIGGRCGTRSGALMKHDPSCEPPELWVLKNTGSFSFEFMGGGKAVICGYDCLAMPSVLGERPCVGMVGGVVYFRGNCGELPEDASVEELDAKDREFLENGLDNFLGSIDETRLKRELLIWKHWRKIVPASGKNRQARPSVIGFHQGSWFQDGIFGRDLDSASFVPLVPQGNFRLNMPIWESQTCIDCRECLKNCPQNAIRRRVEENRPVYMANENRCIGCGICAAVCPREAWQMEAKLE